MIKCPKCGSEVFQTVMHMCKQANVEITGKDIKSLEIHPLNGEADINMLCCTNCNEHYDINDENVVHVLTHPLVKCSECGKDFTPEELDENNVCTICRLKKIDSSFANLENADAFTLMRILAQTRIDNMKLLDQNKATITEAKPKRKKRTKVEIEPTDRLSEDNSPIDIDVEEESNDIEISEDYSPDIPDSVVDISNDINPPEE